MHTGGDEDEVGRYNTTNHPWSLSWFAYACRRNSTRLFEGLLAFAAAATFLHLILRPTSELEASIFLPVLKSSMEVYTRKGGRFR